MSALCDQLPAPPQYVESDALTSALAVRSLSAPPPEAEFLLDIDVEFETDAVDSSAAPTVMRALEVEPVTTPAHATLDAASDQPLLDLPREARTRPEPVVLRKTLRPLLELLPKPIAESESEPLPQTPTLGTPGVAAYRS